MATIGIDLRMVEGRLHGIARYALELARRLPGLAPSHEFFALVPPGGLPGDLGALSPPRSVSLVRAKRGFLSPLEQADLAATLTRLRPHLFHATSFSLPLLWPGRLVATLHDANHLALSGEYGFAQRAYYRAVVGPRARFADALLTVSWFSRRELSRHLSLPEERFQVVPNGVDARFFAPVSSKVDAFRARRGLPRTYLLAVGNEKPFKNLALLGKARFDAKVVLLAGENARSVAGLSEDESVALSAVADEELPLLYAGAAALLLPSRYEGFGLPAVEAMAAGCPVLYAKGSAMDEVCGTAGVALSPDDPSGWREAAARVIRDVEWRRGLLARGRERAEAFSWDRTAALTLAVYERALAKP